MTSTKPTSSTDADPSPIEIACVGCSATFTESLVQLRKVRQAACPSCGQLEEFDESALDSLAMLHQQAEADVEVAELLERLVGEAP